MSAIQRRIYLTGRTLLGGQDVVNLNHLAAPFTVSVIVDIVSGSATYGLEFTHDDINLIPPYRWLSNPLKLPMGQTTSVITQIEFGVTALRLNLQSITGEVRFSVLQGVGTTI